jgi:tetratricopeptide (TPR) repeat protein
MLSRKRRLLTFGSLTLVGLAAGLVGAATQSPEAALKTAAAGKTISDGLLSFLGEKGEDLGVELLKGLGGVSANIFATDAHAVLSEVSRSLEYGSKGNNDLARAIRLAIIAIIQAEIETIGDSDERKSLAKITETDESGWAWVELLEQDSLSEISEEKIPNFFSQKIEEISEIESPVTESQWKHFLLEISRQNDVFISSDTYDKVAKSLYEKFPRSLREVFAEDFANKGTAYGKLLLNLVGDIRASLEEIQSNLDKNHLESINYLKEILQFVRAKNEVESNLTKTHQINLPQTNLYFTGREDILRTIKIFLERKQHVALQGYSGIGKTRTAIEYALQNSEYYSHIFFINASGRELELSLQKVAVELNPAWSYLHKFEDFQREFKSWLETHEGWLLIFDNVDDINQIRALIPANRKGHILYTTNLRQINTIARLIKLDEMPPDEGAALLIKRKLSNPDATINDVSDEEQNYARGLSEETQGLPLFLNIAGSFIAVEEMSIESFYYYYLENKAEILKAHDIADNYEHGSVFVAFTLAYEKIKQPNDNSERERLIAKAAQILLHICAFLVPHNIPEEIILSYFVNIDEELNSIAEDESLWRAVIRKVKHFGFLERDNENRTINIHSLTQEVIKLHLNDELKKDIIEKIIFIMSGLFPPPDFINRPVYELLIPHALRILEYRHIFQIKSDAAVDLLINCGNHFELFGGYEQCLDLYKLSEELSQSLYGTEHPITISSRNGLGEIYRKLGKIDKAIEIFENLLKLKERFISTNPELLFPINNNLAHAYIEKGKFPEAEKLLHEAKDLGEQNYEESIHELALIYNGLSSFYHIQNDYDKAIDYLSKALSINQERYGNNHPETLINLNNLAQILGETGELDTALKLHKQILKARKEFYEKDHFDIAITYFNLAGCYKRKGELDKALRRFQRALDIFTEEYGENNHPKIAECLNSIGMIYEEQRKFGAAEECLKKSIEIYERFLGEESPDVAHVLIGLALFYDTTNKPEKALQTLERAINILSDKFGSNHHKTQSARQLYIVIYLKKIENQGKPINPLGNF